MNTKTTIIVLLIAAALGVYFIVFESGWFGPPPEGESTSVQPGSGMALFEADALKPADVKKLTLEMSGRPPIVIERDPDEATRWIQTAPVRIAAKDWTVNDLIDSAALLRYTNTLKAENLADYGLNPAKMTLTLEGAGADGKSFTHTLKFGRTTAAGQGLLMVDDSAGGGRVYAVEAAMHRQLIELDPMSLRSTTLKEIDLSRVKKLTLKREGLEAALTQDAGRWRFESGASGRVDADAAKSLLDAVNFAVIESFHADNPDNLARYGLAEPKMTLVVEVESNAAGPASAGPVEQPQIVTHTLRIGSAVDLSENKFFAAYEPDASGIVFVIGKPSADRLNIGIDDLRDPRLTPVIASDVREVTVEQSGGAALHFLREEGRWTFGDPNGTGPKPEFGIEAAAVDQLLDALLQTRAVEFVTIAQPSEAEADDEPAPAPLVTVTLAVARQSENESLKITQHGEGQLMAQRVGEDVGYVVNSADLAPAFEPITAYRDRTVWDLQREQIVGLKLERGGKYPANYELTRPADGQWDLGGYDTDAVDRLPAVLTPLRAARWTTEELTDPDVKLTVTLADGSTRTLTASADSKLATTEEGTFEVEPTTVVALTAELRRRKLIEVEYNQIARVQRGELIVECDPDGLFTIQGDPVFDEGMAGQLIDTLAALRADHFVPDDWAKIDVDNPTATLQITPRDGATVTLRLWSAEATGRVGRIDEGTFFTLNGFDYEILAGETAAAPVEPMK